MRQKQDGVSMLLNNWKGVACSIGNAVYATQNLVAEFIAMGCYRSQKV